MAAIELALQWINKFGDMDGDGFVEYAQRSSKGLVQQGWKTRMTQFSTLTEHWRKRRSLYARCRVTCTRPNLRRPD